MKRPSGLAEALRRHLREHPPELGKVQHIEVHHAPDCGFWEGDPCDCAPTIASGPAAAAQHRAPEAGR